MAIEFVPNASGRGGYLRGKNWTLAYRGFKFWRWKPYFSLEPVAIGSRDLYRLGPAGLIVQRKVHL